MSPSPVKKYDIYSHLASENLNESFPIDNQRNGLETQAKALMTSEIRPDTHLLWKSVTSAEICSRTLYILNKNSNVYATIDFSSFLRA